MKSTPSSHGSTRRRERWIAGAAGVAAGGYAALVATAWTRYGRPSPPGPGERDALLDALMPRYEVAERHRVYVRAPAPVVFAAACQMRLQRSALVRAIIRARELVLGATPSASAPPEGLLQETLALGWGMLAERPGRELVMGAVTQPWQANVVFRALPPDEFVAFAEPGFVKIVWTLRADPLGERATVFRTETRVMTTDAVSRRRFRWYWARFSPGIILIRYAMLAALKRDAERAPRAPALRPAATDARPAPS